MGYNRRALLKELDALVSTSPRIRLADVANALGVNRQTIENAMRLNRRMSFREYKRRELLKRVYEMLNQPDLKVKEIGIRLGYASAASFSRFVQRSTGKSPSQLRKDKFSTDRGQELTKNRRDTS